MLRLLSLIAHLFRRSPERIGFIGTDFSNTRAEHWIEAEPQDIRRVCADAGVPLRGESA